MAILALLLNRKLKYVMIDSVDRNSAKGLVTRVIQGNFSIYVNFAAVKFFNLTVTAMVINCAPLLTVLMAAFFLREQIKWVSVVYLLFAFTAVVVMILGAPA